MLVRRADQKALLLGHDELQEVSGLWAIDANQAEAGPIPLAAGAEEGDVWRLLPWPITNANGEKSNAAEKAAKPEAKETKESEETR